MVQQSLYYYVLKQRHKRYTENWQPVSLYDSEYYFRGEAIFETEKEARKYMQVYQSRLQARNEQNHSNNQDRKIRIDLKIFRETDKPQISSYPFYYKKRSYNI